MKGIPVYTTLGTASVDVEIRFLIDGQWLDRAALGKDTERVWGDHRLDLSALESVEQVELTFTATAVADDYERAYSLAKITTSVDFIVKSWNGASRARKFVTGTVELKKTTAKGAKHHLIGVKTVTLLLSDFAGEIELTPLFVAKIKHHDRKVSTPNHAIELGRGGVLGWGEPYVVVLEKAQQGLQSIFDFKWVPFSTGAAEGLRDHDFFAIRWGSRPVIFLNQEVDHLETVLTSTAKTGWSARARDALNSVIAHQALSVAISGSILAAQKSLLNASHLSAEEIFDGMEPQEKIVLRAWLHVADPDAKDEKTPVLESLERLLAMSEGQLQRALIETMPQNLQASLGSRDASEKLLATIMGSNSDGN
jgi:hypothetical protein